MIHRIKRALIFVIILSPICQFVLTVPSWAASENQQVTMNVPSVLSISSSTGDFTLTFADFDIGAQTNVERVVYDISYNNATITDGIIKGKLDSVYTGIDLMANVGAYTKLAGNSSLQEQNPGFVVIDASDVNLCKRVTDSGSGKTSKGRIPIRYIGVATQVLEPGSQIRTLTLTLTQN